MKQISILLLSSFLILVHVTMMRKQHLKIIKRPKQLIKKQRKTTTRKLIKSQMRIRKSTTDRRQRKLIK